MTMWKATTVSPEAAANMQVDAGLLLNNFDVTNPVAPADEDIICATTGDITPSCVPETTDFFDDVNNAPKNTKEGKRITGWNCSFGCTCLEITEDTLKLALGAAGVSADGLGIAPRSQFIADDFKGIYWIGDMVDEDALFCIVMDNTVSTGGVSFTSTKNGKGKLALTLTPHATLADIEKVPMTFYKLEKVDEDAPTYTYTAVSPTGEENPNQEGWYILSGDRYILTQDTTVDSNKTYYERVAEA